jgi:hypothetical protein
MGEPVKPPSGGFNDYYPPPAAGLQSIDAYANRIRRGDNASGAAWRLCTITQPRSVKELIAHVWTSKTDVPADIGMVLADTYSDWVAAGKPAITHS